MAGKKVTVVLSQAPGKVAARRHFEETLAAALLMEPDVAVSLVPHLYDLPANDTGLLFLRGVETDLVALAWLYPRATRWILDRQQVRGRIGASLLDRPPEGDDDADEAAAPPAPRLPDLANVPNRTVWCLDLRDHLDPQTYLEEIRRIVREAATPVLSIGLGTPKLHGNGAANGNGHAKPAVRPLNLLAANPVLPILAAPPNGAEAGTFAGFAYDGRLNADAGARRWYPVIDYTRCTNCMECLDFCLFGVYGVDGMEKILVEQQDNCKKGCPACSRVCPENAIIFPEYKSPAIAGAEVPAEAGNVKIDLSKLFGGDGANAIDMAVRERDRELVADGRTAVGTAVGLPKRQAGKAAQPRDELDDLVDGLDALDL